MLDVLMFCVFFIVFIGIFAGVVVGAVKIEGWRQKRRVVAVAQVLEGGLVTEARGPGAWSLVKVHGRRAGCDVVLEPHVSGNSMSVGEVRMKRMGMRLVILGRRDVGEGAIRFCGGLPALEGKLAELPAEALEKLKTLRSGTATVSGRKVEMAMPLPLSRDLSDEVAALVDGVGPWLASL